MINDSVENQKSENTNKDVELKKDSPKKKVGRKTKKEIEESKATTETTAQALTTETATPTAAKSSTTSTKKKVVRKVKKKEVTADVKEVKEEVVADVKEEVVADVKEELVADVKEEVVTDVKEEVVTDVKEEVVTDVKEELTADVKEVKEEVVADVKEELVVDTKEVKEELGAELKEKVVAEPKVTKTKSKKEVKKVKKTNKKLEEKNIIEEKTMDEIENKINENLIDNTENNYIKNLINENIQENLFIKKEEVKQVELESKINDIVDNLKKNSVVDYETADVKNTFDKFKNGAILVQIIDNKLYYLEKKSNNNKNTHILNILHNLVNKNLINDTTFIVDANNNNVYDENYILRFNRNDNNNNLLIVNYNLDYNFDNIMNISWKDKKDKIYVNKNFVSDYLFDKLKNNKNDIYEFEESINYDNLNENKFVLYEETQGTIDYEIDILRINSLMIKINIENNETLETFYSEYINNDEDMINIKMDKYDLDKIIEVKNNLLEEDCLKKITNKTEKINNILNKETVDNYMKNLLSRLSLKCITEKIVSNKVFITNRESSYLYNRIEVNDNRLDFNFQGKDYEIMLNGNNNKINLLVNEYVTNIFYNGNNIFNHRINDLVSDKQSSNYLIIVRNNMLYVYKNKSKLVLGCRLPELFNINDVGIRTFNKDSWWIC